MTRGQGQVDQTGTPSYVDDDEPHQSEREKARALGRAQGVGGYRPRKWMETSCLHLLATGWLESPMYKRSLCGLVSV